MILGSVRCAAVVALLAAAAPGGARAGEACGSTGGNSAFVAAPVACPKPAQPRRPVATQDGGTVAPDGRSGRYGSTTWTVDGYVRGETVVGKRPVGSR